MKEDNQIINKTIIEKYTIKNKLKTGGFGSVYLAKGVGKDHNQYAVKIIPNKNERYAKIQYQMYQQIKANKFSLGFIKQFDYGKFNDKLFLAMELLGSDLQEMCYKTKERKFSSKTGLMVGLQVIDRLQALHKIGYIHRDIKPDNLAIGFKQKNKVIYLFDFGLARKMKDPLPSHEKGKMVGSLGYMSIKSHEGKQTGISDDLESFTYTIISLIAGNLPWMKIHVQTPADIKRVRSMKETSLGKKWFQNHNVPLQLYQILQYVKGLSSQKQIDYLKIKYFLMNGLNSLNTENDFVFDWCKNRKGQSSTNSPRKEEREQLQKMNQSNQKIVQKQIYQIYKFMDHENKEERQKAMSGKKKQERVKSKQKRERKIEEKQKKQEKKEIKRPMSTKNIRPKNPNKQLEKQISIMDSMKFEGPKIVINRTAIHKI